MFLHFPLELGDCLYGKPFPVGCFGVERWHRIGCPAKQRFKLSDCRAGIGGSCDCYFADAVRGFLYSCRIAGFPKHIAE